MGPKPAPLGVLVLDTQFPRPVGDPGNIDTYNVPVILRKVKGATVDKIVSTTITEETAKLLIDAAKELEKSGVSAITTSCGFLILLQKRLSEAVRVPVFTSTLLLAPTINSLTHKPIGILTANSRALTKQHLREAGAENIDVRIKGLEDKPEFSRVILRNSSDMDGELMARDIVSAAVELVEENPDVGSILCECTNLAPFRNMIMEATGLPVFDYLSLLSLALSSTSPQINRPFYNVKTGLRKSL